MVAFCTLAQVKSAQPVIDHDDDDDILSLLIEAASAVVIDYLDTTAATVLSLTSDGDLESGASVPPAVVVATILTARYMFEHSDELKDRTGGLPFQAEMLLYRLTDPPVA